MSFSSALSASPSAVKPSAILNASLLVVVQDAIDSVAQVRRGETLTSQEKGRRKKILKQLERARKKLKASFEP